MFRAAQRMEPASDFCGSFFEKLRAARLCWRRATRWFAAALVDLQFRT
jgi:hypothetical protein